MSTTAKKRPSSAQSSGTTKERKLLSALIPPPSVYENYVHREFEGYDDIDLLNYADSSNYNVLMFGPTGPGKTTAVRAYAARGHQRTRNAKPTPKPLVTIQCNGGVDPATVWTQPRKDANGQIVYEEALPLLVIRHGGILLFDEVNFLHPRISAVAHSLLDDRRSVTIPELGNEHVEAHPDLFVVCTYNPDYQGTRPLNEAFKNRFQIKMHYDYDTDVEREVISIVPGVSVEPILEIATKLRTMSADGALTTPVSTNMLRDFLVIGNDLDYDFAVANFINTFHVDERQAVANVFELHRDDIETMITLMKEANA